MDGTGITLSNVILFYCLRIMIKATYSVQGHLHC
jgi:hypothetical protein